MIPTTHRAKYVLAGDCTLLEDGVVCIRDPGRISRVARRQDMPGAQLCPTTDWGSAVIVPGFINCHAHLELTQMHQQLSRFASFTDWLSQLMAQRRHWLPQNYLSSVSLGTDMLLASGTVLVGDISASRLSWRTLKTSKIRKIVFAECTALAPERSAEVIAALEMHLEEVEWDPLLASGISPHSPYSVAPELFRSAARLAYQRGIPLAIHAAESESELEFLGQGTGEFREFLALLGALPANWSPPGLAPIPYLDSLRVLDQPVLLIHCNYLDLESMKRILNSRSSVVYCPRSHAFFGHRDHPVRRLLDMGINVALGTDSLASNDSLSMLDEMRYLFSNRKDLSCEEIFRMASAGGASALNFSGLGRLERGHWADMAILKLPAGVGGTHLLADILEGAGECIATIIRGEVAWQKDNPGV
jgi:cytosine/adenosine deaminase-related metal-dependent hydrolase